MRTSIGARSSGSRPKADLTEASNEGQRRSRAEDHSFRSKKLSHLYASRPQRPGMAVASLPHGPVCGSDRRPGSRRRLSDSRFDCVTTAQRTMSGKRQERRERAAANKQEQERRERGRVWKSRALMALGALALIMLAVVAIRRPASDGGRVWSEAHGHWHDQ